MIKKRIFDATLLAVVFVAALMLPVLILTYTEKNPLWVALAGVLLPFGFYTVFAALARHSGKMVWYGFIFIFFSAFQVVLSYLFGNSVVASDMFLNLMTTNAGEATELLSNIYPAVILVFIVYLPLLWMATMHIRKKIVLKDGVRH